MKAKFKQAREYIGTVHNTTLKASGRTKREAVKRLRAMFRERGIVTQPDPVTDLLLMDGGTGAGYRARHPDKPYDLPPYNTPMLSSV